MGCRPTVEKDRESPSSTVPHTAEGTPGVQKLSVRDCSVMKAMSSAECHEFQWTCPAMQAITLPVEVMISRIRSAFASKDYSMASSK